MTLVVLSDYILGFFFKYGKKTDIVSEFYKHSRCSLVFILVKLFLLRAASFPHSSCPNNYLNLDSTKRYGTSEEDKR